MSEINTLSGCGICNVTARQVASLEGGTALTLAYVNILNTY